MVGYVNSNNKTILWSIPRPPHGFINISKANNPGGRYIFGDTGFKTKEMPLTSIFRRKLAGPAEEFLLGMLSVLIIAVLSEIVQSLLMRTRRRRHVDLDSHFTDEITSARTAAPRSGIQFAFLLDEFYHFRNLSAHIFGNRNSHRSESRPVHTEPSEQLGIRIQTSLFVLVIALSLMAADVFCVYLTQPVKISSKGYHYNLRGIQPVSTDQGVSKWIRRMTRERTCATPIFSKSGQSREFTIAACIHYDIKEAHNDVKDHTNEIIVTSFFHKAGSDHTVAFDDGRIDIRQRSYIYTNEAGTRRLLYATQETDDFAYTKYIHELFIYSSMEWNCNRKTRTKSCEQLVSEFQKQEVVHNIIEKEIIYWRPKGPPHTGIETGLETKYRVAMNNAFATMEAGIYPLTATAMLEEVRGPGAYVNNTSEQVNDHVDGLIVDEGRVAGLATLLLVFAVLFIVLLALRATLRPDSLGGLAWDAERNLYNSRPAGFHEESVFPTTLSEVSLPYSEYNIGLTDGESIKDHSGQNKRSCSIAERSLQTIPRNDSTTYSDYEFG